LTSSASKLGTTATVTYRDQLEPTIQPAGSNQSHTVILFGPLSLGTCLAQAPCCPLASKLCVQSPNHAWRQHGNLGGYYPLFSTNTVTSRSGGGRGAGADCKTIISAIDTSLMSSNTDMYTVVYDPDMHLQPQDVPTSRIVFANMSTIFQTGYHRTTTRTPNSSQPRTSDLTP
jgi:hypothetical protein